jgi:hypothetical protein
MPGGAVSWQVLGCDDGGVTEEWEGPTANFPDWIGRAAQQEQDKWPEMGLIYMLVEVPERCPHGTVETATTKCRDCNRERALKGGNP